MGTYVVYSIRTKSVRALIGGEKRNVYPYKYSYKPYFTMSKNYGGDDRREARAVISLNRILKRENHPDGMIYVCFGDPLSIDVRVYECQRDRMRPTIYDTYFSIATSCGYLYRYKLGRKKLWIVAKELLLIA